MKDNLEEVVNGIRAELEKGFGGSWSIQYPGLKPIALDVIPDGITWIIVWKFTTALGFEHALEQTVDGKEFIHFLYVQVRRIVDYATGRRKGLGAN